MKHNVVECDWCGQTWDSRNPKHIGGAQTLLDSLRPIVCKLWYGNAYYEKTWELCACCRVVVWNSLEKAQREQSAIKDRKEE